MYLKITKIDSKILELSKKYFSDNFYNFLNQATRVESLFARFLICKYIEKEENIILSNSEKNNFISYETWLNWTKIWNRKYFFSISHKKELVFIWVNNSKIWLDIELNKNRDESLLNKFNIKEYSILWWKNWDNFYLLWTSKESIIKYLNLGLDNIEDVILIKEEILEENIWWIIFSRERIFKYKWKKIIVYWWKDKDMIYSVVF